MEPIWIDTDAGDDIDDVLAIAFAVRRPELNVVGISTVSYDAGRRAALVRQVLAACGRPEIPVAVGASYPLRPLDEAQRERLREERRMNHCPATADRPPRDECDAVTEMAKAIEAHDGRLTLVAIGPSTNIAMLLLRRPDLVPRIKAIALMGGEMALRRGEHNVVSDDVAAQHVLACGRTVFLGTWNVTRQVVLMPPEVERLRHSGSHACQLFAELHDRWHPAQSWKPGPVMYDLAPILWSFRPELFETERQCVAVDLTGTHTRGWTVPVPGDATVEVSKGMDAAAAHRLLMETLLSIP